MIGNPWTFWGTISAEEREKINEEKKNKIIFKTRDGFDIKFNESVFQVYITRKKHKWTFWNGNSAICGDTFNVELTKIFISEETHLYLSSRYSRFGPQKETYFYFKEKENAIKFIADTLPTFGEKEDRDEEKRLSELEELKRREKILKRKR